MTLVLATTWCPPKKVNNRMLLEPKMSNQNCVLWGQISHGQELGALDPA